jgi:predicted membrane-bound spermidine synthase
MLVVEIVAGRMLAPFLGVSLYTWTGIIGVVLSGMALGAYLGGFVGDRFPRPSTLGWILLISSLGVFSIPPLTHWAEGALLQADLVTRIVLVTAVLFFVPTCFLGMISPVAVKLALAHLKETGNVVGRVYAVSTLGSILGTFASGFFLISWLGTRNVLFLTGVILFIAAPLLGGLLAQKKRALLFLALLLFLWPLHRFGFDPAIEKDTLLFTESSYFTIRLKGDPPGKEDRLVTLYLDQLTHSCSDPVNPLRLQYRYIRSYKEIVEWQAPKRKSLKTLFIGGGGYTFPRFVEATLPGSEIDVVEIDPAVTRVSRDYLGLGRDSRIRTFNEDARWFVMNRQAVELYDFIFEDAFNDLSIPYHLTTKEFAVQLKRLLKKDGLLLTNVIDRFEKGSFLPSYIRTLEEVFGKGNVHLIVLGEFRDFAGVVNRVVVAGPRAAEIEDLERSLAGLAEGERVSYVMPQERLQRFLDQFAPVILTDDYVPVDNLTAPNFR